VGIANTGQPIILDVAARAGVSYQTVSRVVNGSGPVRASTRARVEEAIAQLGWVPDAAAQQLSRRRAPSDARAAAQAQGPGTAGAATVTRGRPGVPPPATVLVTGGSGKLGQAVVDHLLGEGYRVVVADLRAPHRGDVPWTRADLSDAGQAIEVLCGVDDRWGRADAVVHLAAVPAPGLLPDATLFATNITTTYNVFAAARRAGVGDVVWASSETVLGLPLLDPPPSFPLDEETGPTPTTSYSLSKTLEEEMARQFAGWMPGSSFIGLRLSNVMAVEDYAAFPGFDDDPSLRRWNGWSYVDARDAARAVGAALTHPVDGAELFVVANADTVMSRSTAQLVGLEFPGVPVGVPLGPHTSLMSTEKARRLLDWVPVHSWRDEIEVP